MLGQMRQGESTDAMLLRRSLRHPDSFVEVCRRHSAALDGWLAAELRDDGLARELLAETLAEAWFCRRRFVDRGDGSARPWLFGIAHNLVRRVRRDRAIETRARARLGLPTPEADAYTELIERLAAEQQLGSAAEQLERLPIEQRDALELRVLQELDYDEIGHRLDITPEGARTRVFRALGTLRSQLGRTT
jgi:RNA polymerase sigma factor (sigma-70 family)